MSTAGSRTASWCATCRLGRQRTLGCTMWCCGTTLDKRRRCGCAAGRGNGWQNGGRSAARHPAEGGAGAQQAEGRGGGKRRMGKILRHAVGQKELQGTCMGERGKMLCHVVRQRKEILEDCTHTHTHTHPRPPSVHRSALCRRPTPTSCLTRSRRRLARACKTSSSIFSRFPRTTLSASSLLPTEQTTSASGGWVGGWVGSSSSSSSSSSS
eukprot:240461-Chlamydomonas_euryale.AAC.1